MAETLEEADAFLDDCMAVVADSFKDVKDYFEENGMDTAGLTKEELLEESEVFALPDGKYLIVEDRCDGKFDFQPECHGSVFLMMVIGMVLRKVGWVDETLRQRRINSYSGFRCRSFCFRIWRRWILQRSGI